MRKMHKAVLAVLTAGIFMFSLISLPLPADAGYYTTENVDVDDGYQHVGFTPEKITIESNIKHSSSLQDWRITSATIQLFIRDNTGNNVNEWRREDGYTFTNTWGTGGAITQQSFTFNVDTWRHSFLGIKHGDSHYQFKIDLPRTKKLQFNTEGNDIYKAKVTLIATAAASPDTDGDGQREKFTVIGSTGSMDVKPTDWEDYSEYWGYGATASGYDSLMATQSDTQDTYGISPYSESYLDDTGNVMLVASISIAVVILVVSAAIWIKRQ